MRRYTEFLLRFRWPLMLTIICLLVAAVMSYPKVEFDLAIGPLLEASEERKAEAEEFEKALPRKHIDLVSVLEFPDPIGLGELSELQRIGDDLKQREEIVNLISLATTRIMVSENGEPPRPRLFREYALEKGYAHEIAIERGLLRGTLISDDGRSAAILLNVRLGKGGDFGEYLKEIKGEIQQLAGEDVNLHMLGGQVVQESMTYHMKHDMVQSVVLEFFCFLILLPILFRTLRGVVLPLFVVASAISFHMGLMVLFGQSLSSIEVAVPGLIVIIGLCDAVHVIHRFEEELINSNYDKRKAILDTMEKVGMACFFTSFTTAVGFMSLLIAPHSAVKDFALTASSASMVAFAVVITLLPIVMSFWPIKPGNGKHSHAFSNISYGKPRLTFGIFIICIVLAVVGITRMVVDSHWLEELPPNDPAVHALNWYEKHFGGVLDVTLGVEGELDTPEAYAAIRKLEERMATEAGVTGLESYTLWVRELTGNPAEMTDALARRGIQYMKLAGKDFPHYLIDPEFKNARIVFKTNDVGTARYLELRDLIVEEAQKLPPSIKGSVGGYANMAHESTRLVVTTMMNSFLLSALTITIFIMIIYKSFKIGIISILPNTLPILAALGVNGWMDMPLRIGIVMIYSLGVGLAVDDTIHLLTRFNQERLGFPGRSIKEHLLRTLRTTGSAMITTSLVLAVGALCYLPSSFQSMKDVGILLTVIVMTALIADLFLIPHILEYLYRNEEPTVVTDD